jgi:hypothetical protein
MKSKYLLIIVFILFMTACANLGPNRLKVDRFNYNEAISSSWKQQTLLNIIKLRYADMPIFLEVTSIVNSYSVENSVHAGSEIGFSNTPGDTFVGFGGAGKYTDRPTITYSPVTGDAFNQKFMAPIPPPIVFSLLQSGWPAELILTVTVDAINGYRAQHSAGPRVRKSSEKFHHVIELFSEIQKLGGINLKITNHSYNKISINFVHDKHVTKEALNAEKKFRKLLGIAPNAKEIDVIYGEISPNSSTIAIQTRSMMQIMQELSAQIDVPPKHIELGYTIPSIINKGSDVSTDPNRLITIHNDINEPNNVYVKVKYNEYWYWIERTDYYSKEVFSYLMLLFSIMETGKFDAAPIITIPAG